VQRVQTQLLPCSGQNRQFESLGSLRKHLAPLASEIGAEFPPNVLFLSYTAAVGKALTYNNIIRVTAPMSHTSR
jgi:hypothetical protein